MKKRRHVPCQTQIAEQLPGGNVQEKKLVLCKPGLAMTPVLNRGQKGFHRTAKEPNKQRKQGRLPAGEGPERTRAGPIQKRGGSASGRGSVQKQKISSQILLNTARRFGLSNEKGGGTGGYKLKDPNDFPLKTR